MVFAAAISFGGIFATSLADPVSCPANDINAFVCRDGTVCDHFTHPDGAGCCVSHGGRYQCPSSWPHMCSGINGRTDFCEDDHCCVASADMCSRPSVDRSVLQDCPDLKSADTTDICPYYHGPQQSFPNITIISGSSVSDYFWPSLSMEVQEDGKVRPGVEWPFCPAHDEATKLLCMSGKTCDVLTHPLKWACCALEGGRHRCPTDYPVMCEEKICVGFEPCCAASDSFCALGPANACPGSNSTTSEATRQCHANAPVMCNDKSCVATKEECADGVLKSCPEVPTCAASRDWEATAVGGTAHAPCDDDVNGPREGRMLRSCNSMFTADGKEYAQWGRIVRLCRPVSLKCDPAVTADGKPVPALRLDFAYVGDFEHCPAGLDGYTLYRCRDAGANKTSQHIVTEFCDEPCNNEIYCHNRGVATRSNFTVNPFQRLACSCSCDAGWEGFRCTRRASDRRRKLPHPALMTLIFAVSAMCCVGLCFRLRALKKGNRESRLPSLPAGDETDSEGEVNAAAPEPYEKSAVEV